MKRQRNVECNGSSKVHVTSEGSMMTTKIVKKRGVIKDEVGIMAEDQEFKCNELSPTSIMRAGEAAESSPLLGWDQESWWPWLNGTVDEQMSWGSFWLPFWDVEFMAAGEAYNVLFGDVVWDDDIWGIRGIKEVSNS